MGLRADDRRKLLAGRSPSVAYAGANHTDDIEPGVIGASPAGVATVGGRVMLQRVANYVRSRLPASPRQSVQSAFRSRAQPDGQRHPATSVIQISITRDRDGRQPAWLASTFYKLGQEQLPVNSTVAFRVPDLLALFEYEGRVVPVLLEVKATNRISRSKLNPVLSFKPARDYRRAGARSEYPFEMPGPSRR